MGPGDPTNNIPVRAFIRFAWITLVVTVVVIVWGAVVRATGSGAGCGSHWPLCNGDVVPLAPAASTVIEFTHRLTSGLALLLTVVLFVWSRRLFPAGHRARAWAAAALVFMLGEAAIGAGIVLLDLVEDNASALRAVYQGLHLTNTMLLVGALTGTIQASQKEEGRSQKEMQSQKAEVRTKPMIAALLLMIFVGATGAIAALGNTLFPVSSLAEGFRADLDPASHFLIRLRASHPILAVLGAAVALWAFRNPLITSLVLAQAGLGVVNLLLHAPLLLQMVHLMGSNVLWIVMVWAWRDRH